MTPLAGETTMVPWLRRCAKAKLPELVEAASRGQDVLITVRGKIKARLTRVAPPDPADRRAWIRELRKFRKTYSVAKPTLSIEQILDEIREDRF